MRRLPLSREEAVGPNLVGSSFPIICWFAPMHQTNVVASTFSLTTRRSTSNNSCQNPKTRAIGGRDGTQWNLKQLWSTRIELARRSNNSNAVEEFFFCPQAVGAMFDSFVICWKK
jgi:hypothetical protein